MQNIQIVSDNYICSACGACIVACHHNAISFLDTSVGRKYAKVDSSLCVNCGLCYKVCPSVNAHSELEKYMDPFVGSISHVFIGKASDEHVFSNSQSGGVCTAILGYLFDEDLIDAAIVCRMSYGKRPVVEGFVAKSKEQLFECQKSCYTPVDLLSVIKGCSDKKSIAVVGLPCHIEGALLLRQQIAKCKNINYLIGLICDRTLCAGIMDVMAAKSTTKDIKIEWRKKDFSYHGVYYSYRNAPVVLSTRKGILKVIPNYQRFLLKDVFTPPRCRVCSDKLNLFGDIVLGDPWGMEGVNWNKGRSLVIARTQKGVATLNEMKEKGVIVVDRDATIDEVINGQHIETRKMSHARYVQALYEIISNDIVLKFNRTTDVNNGSDQHASNELRQFISLENLRREDVTRRCRALICKERIRRMPIVEYATIIYSKVRKLLYH